MDISSSFVYTPELARQSFRACHPRSPLARWLPAGIYVVLGILALAEALRGARVDPVGLAVGVVVLLLGLGWPVFYARRVARALRPLTEPGTIRLELTDAGYAAEAPGRTTSRLWPTFKSAALVRGFWVLKTESEGTLAFPASVLDAAQNEAFQAAMRDKGLLKR
ncbi:hypothetical protein SAMN05421837_11411 [Amycolatopsis pretoriensis]|uniref:YcxB-like protein n=1 Tax=Amycolatopsis pretoriensis TaxID=218821 RepID=A0A1H5RIX1_9PSEU|nr:hypothetical protein [Amycolatopsis pretoriensis]SEF37451.1 hypothetical protein SAMN05421837_11411 [Amycolatopsis pretoriensis]